MPADSSPDPREARLSEREARLSEDVHAEVSLLSNFCTATQNVRRIFNFRRGYKAFSSHGEWNTGG